MRKIGILALVLVFAFGTLGVSYAHWSQELYIDQTIQTGTLGIGFWEAHCYEDDEVEGKDVASINCTMVDQKGEKYDPFTGTMKPVYERILVNIYNAYPCYFAHIVHTVVNFGTIPVIITSYNLSDPTGELNFAWSTPPPNTPAYGYFWKDFNKNGVFDGPDEEIINVKLVNLVGTQLHPCSEEKGELDLHFKQPAEQGHTYHIKAVITGIQWNLA